MTKLSLKRPWKTAEGFLLGGGLFAMGSALQLSMGPVRWSLFAAPVNGVLLALLLGALVLMFLLRKKVYALEWMMHGQAAFPGFPRCFLSGPLFLSGPG